MRREVQPARQCVIGWRALAVVDAAHARDGDAVAEELVREKACRLPRQADLVRVRVRVRVRARVRVTRAGRPHC